MNCPRLLLAALRGGAGKTTLTLGSCRLARPGTSAPGALQEGSRLHRPGLARPGRRLPQPQSGPLPHGRGPDYGHGGPSRQPRRRPPHIEATAVFDDGLDAQGTYSTAELARFSDSGGVGGGLHHDHPHRRRPGPRLSALRPPSPPPGGDSQPGGEAAPHEEMLRSTIQRYCACRC